MIFLGIDDFENWMNNFCIVNAQFLYNKEITSDTYEEYY